jgi:hypothetical protein
MEAPDEAVASDAPAATVAAGGAAAAAAELTRLALGEAGGRESMPVGDAPAEADEESEAEEADADEGDEEESACDSGEEVDAVLDAACGAAELATSAGAAQLGDVAALLLQARAQVRASARARERARAPRG